MTSGGFMQGLVLGLGIGVGLFAVGLVLRKV